MKLLRLLLLVFSMTPTIAILAQVGIGTVTPDASAQLELSSTTRGMLVPRMTSAQRLENVHFASARWSTKSGYFWEGD